MDKSLRPLSPLQSIFKMHKDAKCDITQRVCAQALYVCDFTLFRGAY